MATILDSILFIEESLKRIFENFQYVIVHILLHLVWRIQIVNKIIVERYDKKIIQIWMPAIFDAILFFEESSKRIFEDF